MYIYIYVYIYIATPGGGPAEANRFVYGGACVYIYVDM